MAEREQERDVAFDRTLELAREHGLRGGVVLGDPGSGKSTLLKHFVLASTDPMIGPATLGLPPETIPVLIELRRLKDPAAGLRPAIEQAVASADVSLQPAEFTRELLRRDRLLVLVDGLDEVADTAMRAEVSRWLEEAIAHHLPESTFVVTSRYAGYKGDAPICGKTACRFCDSPTSRSYRTRRRSCAKSPARSDGGTTPCPEVASGPPSPGRV